MQRVIPHKERLLGHVDPRALFEAYASMMFPRSVPNVYESREDSTVSSHTVLSPTNIFECSPRGESMRWPDINSSEVDTLLRDLRN